MLEKRFEIKQEKQKLDQSNKPIQPNKSIKLIKPTKSNQRKVNKGKVHNFGRILNCGVFEDGCSLIVKQKDESSHPKTLYIMNANIIMCGMKSNKTDFLEKVSYWSKIYYENCTITDRK